MKQEKDDTVMIGISRKLRDALKAKCAQQGRKIKETVEELIEKFLDANEKLVKELKDENE